MPAKTSPWRFSLPTTLPLQVMLVKNELQKAGFRTWMDVDRMSGSTLEAMADAVERSAVVIVCVSKRYKESQVRALSS